MTNGIPNLKWWQWLLIGALAAEIFEPNSSFSKWLRNPHFIVAGGVGGIGAGYGDE